MSVIQIHVDFLITYLSIGDVSDLDTCLQTLSCNRTLTVYSVIGTPTMQECAQKLIILLECPCL